MVEVDKQRRDNGRQEHEEEELNDVNRSLAMGNASRNQLFIELMFSLRW